MCCSRQVSIGTDHETVIVGHRARAWSRVGGHSGFKKTGRRPEPLGFVPGLTTAPLGNGPELIPHRPFYKRPGSDFCG
ncbi:hypothetical protein SBA2_980016 [Acidobacteriia bacterium SbA2]|nr:hypothetical protein SBA2_980016 [Acidobacteriia bacterium SbA2]